MKKHASPHSGLPAFAILAAACAFVHAVPAAAADRLGDGPFGNVPALARSELGKLRGGMMVNGIPMDFAVVLSTTVQNAAQPAETLATTLAFNNAGGIARSSSTATGGAMTLSPMGGIGLMAGGGTSIFEQVLSNQVNTLIRNTANRTMVTHLTTLNVTLPGFLQATRNANALFAASRMGLAGGMAGLGH